jgi:orotidine-5'-phosphate decarboxylase
MSKLPFKDLLKQKWNEGKFVCVGLDPDFEKLPQSVKESSSKEDAIFNFNKAIIDSTHKLVCAYKPNTAFYEAEGVEGWKALDKTCKYINDTYPDIPIILDAKRADIGNTNALYAKALFDNLGADAITVNPYPGKEAMQPFLDYKDKGIIIWLGASSPGRDKLQNLKITDTNKPLYQYIARQIAESWNTNGNCLVVVGATYPDQLKEVREIIGDMPILLPGVGAQGGDLKASLENGLDSNKQGLIISSSRGIIFSDNPKQATLSLHEQIKGLI